MKATSAHPKSREEGRSGTFSIFHFRLGHSSKFDFPDNPSAGHGRTEAREAASPLCIVHKMGRAQSELESNEHLFCLSEIAA